MASSPASGVANVGIDPSRQARFSLQIADSLMNSSSNDTSYSSIRINHRPTKSGGRRTTKMQTTSENSATMSIRDKEQGTTKSYTYEGTRHKVKKSYVLVFEIIDNM